MGSNSSVEGMAKISKGEECYTVKALHFEKGGGCMTPPAPMVAPPLAGRGGGLTLIILEHFITLDIIIIPDQSIVNYKTSWVPQKNCLCLCVATQYIN